MCAAFSHTWRIGSASRRQPKVCMRLDATVGNDNPSENAPANLRCVPGVCHTKQQGRNCLQSRGEMICEKENTDGKYPASEEPSANSAEPAMSAVGCPVRHGDSVHLLFRLPPTASGP